MTIHRLCGDWMHFAESLPNGYFDHVIMDPDYYTELIVDELLRVSKGNIVLFGDPMYRHFYRRMQVVDEYENKEAIPVMFDAIHHWVKPPSTKNTTKRMSNFVEEILVIRRGDVFNHKDQWANRAGVFFDIVEGEVVHPYQKPLALIERLVRVYTNEGDTVFDGTMGSGTLLRACKNLGRNAVGCEIDPEIFKLSEGLDDLLDYP